MLLYPLRSRLRVRAYRCPGTFPCYGAAWTRPVLAGRLHERVSKPAEQTPLTALRVASFLCGGFSPGRGLNRDQRHGSTCAGLWFTARVDKIAFTGSTRRRPRYRRQGGTSRSSGVTLDLGGKSPNVISPTSYIIDRRSGLLRASTSTSTPARPATPARACSCLPRELSIGYGALADRQRRTARPVPGPRHAARTARLGRSAERSRYKLHLDSGRERSQSCSPAARPGCSATAAAYLLFAPTLFSTTCDELKIALGDLRPVLVASP